MQAPRHDREATAGALPRRRRRRWPFVVAGVLLLPLAMVALVLAAALQHEPAVIGDAELAPQDVARAIALARTHDPRRSRPGLVRTAVVGERDIEVLLSHGARRWLPGTSGRASFERGVARVSVSTHLGALPRVGPLAAALAAPFGRWVNVELVLEQTGGWPAPASLHVGRLRVPLAVAEPVLAWWLGRQGLVADWNAVQDVVRRVRFQPDTLFVTYAWQSDSLARMKASLLAPDELARLRPYHDLLVLLSGPVPEWHLPLPRMLQPMMALAARRSAAGADPVAENRAAIVALTLYANGRHVGDVAPAARDWPRARPLRLTLAGRPDFPLHFLISAALVTESTSPLARAIGLYKEIKDSQGGSGFSFNDMAANRAGQRFGELALAAPQELQRRVARDGLALADADLLPPVADLPEFMPEAEFRRRFGGVGEPAYEAMVAEIERRVGSLELLR